MLPIALVHFGLDWRAALVLAPLLLLVEYFVVIQAERGGAWRVLFVLWPTAWAYDVLVNLLFVTVVLVDAPREATLSTRVKRLVNDSTWRGEVARYLRRVLDAIAPSGRHI